jgi:hypothetical protein
MPTCRRFFALMIPCVIDCERPNGLPQREIGVVILPDSRRMERAAVGKKDLDVSWPRVAEHVKVGNDEGFGVRNWSVDDAGTEVFALGFAVGIALPRFH